ncbi:MAG: DUF4421 family protein [Spirochaetes bacterium]|nr:DUF4421 family protein [Spirochaetota bacterium]
MKKLFFLIMGLSIFIPLFSEEETDETVKNFNIRLFANSPIQNIEMKTIVEGEQKGKEVSYDANPYANAGISASYKWLGFTYSRAVGSLKDQNKFGKTKARDYQFYLYQKHFGADIFYQNYSGYYLRNPSDFGYIEGDPETIRSDIKVRNIGVNIYYSFSDDFSLSECFKQMENNFNSSGSPLVSLSVNEFKISGDSSLIPESVQADYGDFADYRGGRYKSISAGGGYAYLKTYSNNLYASAALMAAVGYMNSREDLHEKNIRSHSLSINVNLKLSAGYSSDYFYAGLTAFAFVNSTSKSEKEDKTYTDISCTGGTIELFAGIRF